MDNAIKIFLHMKIVDIVDKFRSYVREYPQAEFNEWQIKITFSTFPQPLLLKILFFKYKTINRT